MTGIINSALTNAGMQFSDYGGQQVRTDDAYKQSLAEGAANMSASTGKAMSAQDYDKMVNPTTYGARWGAAAPAPSQASTSNAGGGPVVSQGYDAAQQAPAVSSDITKRVIDPATETTAGQVQGIINQNSPLMQQAQARALQQANDRGLGNSSLAIGAAQGAVLSAATPIANADAGVYGNAANMNTTTQNQFTAQKDATQNQINSNNTGAINTASAFSADSSNKASIANADNETKRMAQSTQMALGNLDAQSKQLLQTNSSATNLFNQTITNLANIASSTTMDAAAKQAATDNQMTLLHQGMTAIGATAATKPGDIASLNLGQYFTPAATAPATQPTAAAPTPSAAGGLTREGS